MCSNGVATAACSPKDIYIDSPKEQGSWLRKVRQSGEYSNVSIIVENQAFHLHMLPLLQESSHLREVFSSRGVSRDQPPGTDMAIELPNFPGGAAIFAKAMDFCYSIDVKFSTSNVAAIMAASKYLGMGNLLKKAEEFLERSVYKNWRNCLLLWAAIDRNKEAALLYNGRLNDVTHKCERGFLDCIATRRESDGHLWCNIRDVREMVALSSLNLASRVFETLVGGNMGLYYGVVDSIDASASSIVLYQPCSHPMMFSTLHLDSSDAADAAPDGHDDDGSDEGPALPSRFSDRANWRSVCDRNAGEAILWLKNLPMALTSDWQRAIFYRYVGEWITEGMEDENGERSPPLVLEGFLLSLLVEATKLVSRSPNKQFSSPELMAVIGRLKAFRNIWLQRVDLKWLANTVPRSELDHYSFEILQAIAKRIKEVHETSQAQQQQHQQQQHRLNSSHSSQFFILGGGSCSKESFKEIAKIEKLIKAGNPFFYAEKAAANFEDSLLLQLKKKSLSVEQVLGLLQEFPADLRSSHEGLYRALEQISKVRPWTAAELHDINTVLDYRMVSDEVVKSAFRHPKLGFSHSLLSRTMELEIAKLDRMRLHYDQDEDCLSSREQLVRTRKCHLILEKALRTHMRASVLLSERYRSLEDKLDALTRSSPQSSASRYADA